VNTMNGIQMNRRGFLKSAGMGTMGAITAGVLSPETKAAVQNADPMRITKIEAVRVKDEVFWWVLLHTNNGLVGIGETCHHPDGEIGILKNLARFIIGRDPRDIDRLWQDVFDSHWAGWGGADIRVITAMNIAQFDILGKALDVPIYRLLNGKAQEKLRIYNTSTYYRPVEGMIPEKDIEKLSKFFIERGIKAQKIYPYNETARKNGGTYISPADLDRCLGWVRRIRDSVGDEMDIAIDFSGMWNLPCAQKIAHSLEPFNIMWIEEIIRQDNIQSYATIAKETSIPVCVSERLATRYQYRELMESKACDIVMYDLCWCGGISEAKKISDLADTYYIPTAPHGFEGPLSWVAAIQVSMALTNFFILESCYPQYTVKYPHFFTNIPQPVDGFVTAPEGPGLGVEFREEPFKTGEVTVETIAEL
ncbi:enolase C-terminal domain-like protein, partial [Candidatus Latescibacterota bacterium]